MKHAEDVEQQDGGEVKFVVEMGVPMPRARRASKSSALVASLRELPVGGSVLIVGGNHHMANNAKNVAARATGFTFTARLVEGGVRVWRIK